VKVVWEDAYSIIEPQITAEGVHVWPFDPTFPVDVRYLVFKRRHEIRLNRHDYFELLYFHSGEAIYRVQSRTLKVREGDLFVMGSTSLHRMIDYPRGRVRAGVLYFLPELIRSGDGAEEEVEYLMPFLVQDSSFPHVIPAHTRIPLQVFDLMKRTNAELPAASNWARLSIKTYLKMILVLLVNHYASFRGTEETFHHKNRDLERLRPLFTFIDQHYAEPLSVEHAASLICMSKSHFMRFFKQVTGQSFVSHLNRFRVAKAQSLLTSADKSIAEISQEVGFYDQSYFGMVFHKLVGVTPREFKQQVTR
jgi:AraC-like DNA-binding protein/quercetin dioxygenase-like cupin family protein